ncbi:MAG TPA: hypothetical protein VF086_08810 [Propionibacteriaceae bacterium]
MDDKLEPKFVERLQDENFPGPFSCNCETDCAGYSQCACIRDYETKRCRCICGNPHVTLKADEGRQIKPDGMVDLFVKNTSLDVLAEFLSKLSYDELFIPAKDLKREVSLSLKEVPLSQALKEVGLISRPSGSK